MLGYRVAKLNHVRLAPFTCFQFRLGDIYESQITSHQAWQQPRVIFDQPYSCDRAEPVLSVRNMAYSSNDYHLLIMFFHEIPEKAPAYVALVLFFLGGLVGLQLAIKSKAKFMLLVPITAWLEVAGFICRILLLASPARNTYIRTAKSCACVGFSKRELPSRSRTRAVAM